jgi:hypothetical protein
LGTVDRGGIELARSNLQQIATQALRADPSRVIVPAIDLAARRQLLGVVDIRSRQG